MKILRLLLFNFFTRQTFKTGNGVFYPNNRLKTMVTDLNYSVSVLLPFFIVIIIPQVFIDTKSNSNTFNHSNLDLVSSITFSIIIFFLLNKDYYKARSIGKRIYGYQIFDVQTNMPANSTKCMIRNITCLIWPIEAIIVLINPKRRLGDFIAGTILIDKEPEEPESILDDMIDAVNYEDSRRTVFLSIAFTALLLLLAMFPTELYHVFFR